MFIEMNAFCFLAGIVIKDFLHFAAEDDDFFGGGEMAVYGNQNTVTSYSNPYTFPTPKQCAYFRSEKSPVKL